jgi:replicative DNA helicase
MNDGNGQVETVLADLDAERALIAAMLVDNGVVERSGIGAEHFADESHASIWKAAQAINFRGEQVSLAVLAAALPALKSYIGRVAASGASLSAASEYALTVRGLAARRRLLALTDKLRERVGDMSVAVEEIVAEASGELASAAVGREARTKRAIAESILEDLDRPAEFFSTGIGPLDEVMGGGLMAGKLYGINARKKVGKTLLLGTISHNLNRQHVKHLFICLEMSATEIEQRNIARDKGFNAIRFLRRDLPDLRQRVADYAVTAPNFTLFEHAPGATFNELRGIIGRARLKGIRGVILDYLQLVGGKAPKETEEYHIRRVAQWLADAARQIGLFFLVAGQLNQEGGTRGGEGLNLACDQLFVLQREQHESVAWMEMVESRHTLYRNVGSETSPGFWLRKHGPHFSDEPPPLADLQSSAGGEA